MPVPDSRIRAANRAPVNPGGEYVLYWMIASRRTEWSFALDRAVEHSVTLGRPLVILEALRVGYPWASDRLHRFVIEGMRDQAQACSLAQVLYYPYIEMDEGAGKGLLEALAARAAVVVTDDYPAFFLPRMVAAAAPRVPVRLEAVDSNGLLPVRDCGRRRTPPPTAFGRRCRSSCGQHLEHVPSASPLANRALPPVTWDVIPHEIMVALAPVQNRRTWKTPMTSSRDCPSTTGSQRRQVRRAARPRHASACARSSRMGCRATARTAISRNRK